ncbi:MAG: N-6 DNA methylase [Bernardetiaceae bacterium]|nr:N-6 DNA methylase [Bernardetiaceae bacterium]
MPIFQHKLIEKERKALDMSKVEEAWTKYQSVFLSEEVQHNIRKSKEEQYQRGFLQDLFQNVLGYTLNPTSNFNLTTEFKNVKDSKKADGAILSDKGKVLAVIELKGTATTDLNKVEVQAFGYKNNQPGCKYVITSNFEKLRFYVDNAVDYEEFYLFRMDKYRFERLWICLAAENLLAGLPDTLKKESLAEEESITHTLYKEYAHFRDELFDDMQRKNPTHNKLLLFQKTQKLLDRFLFLFFAEDRLLLPPNSSRAILRQWMELRDEYDAYIPLYQRFAKHFNYLKIGKKGKGHYNVFPYNGELFAKDELLDSLTISDELLYQHVHNLSKYDYQSEVSVNILGHIFEHSLNEIEEIQAKLAGESLDKNQSKRKKDGIFYTPKYITQYIIASTLGRRCAQIKQQLGISEEENFENLQTDKAQIATQKQKLDAYRNALFQITVCDPACGSGAFLNQALEFFLAEHEYLDELYEKLLGEAQSVPHIGEEILAHNIYGVDLNDESVEIAKLSLWLRTAKKGRKLTALSQNIKCGNSLIANPEIAGTKAFDWQKEFPQIFENGGFDVVVGNPPYGAALDEKEKEYLGEKDSLVPDYESYVYFISLYKSILKKTGLLSYIFPNTFLSNFYGVKYRTHLLESVSIYELIDLSFDNTFEDASVRTCILSLVNEPCSEDFITDFLKAEDKEIIKIRQVHKAKMLKSIDNVLKLFSMEENADVIIDKIAKHKALSSFHRI